MYMLSMESVRGIFILLQSMKYVENSGCYTVDERTKGMLRFQHF